MYLTTLTKMQGIYFVEVVQLTCQQKLIGFSNKHKSTIFNTKDFCSIPVTDIVRDIKSCLKTECLLKIVRIYSENIWRYKTDVKHFLLLQLKVQIFAQKCTKIWSFLKFFETK